MKWAYWRKKLKSDQYWRAFGELGGWSEWWVFALSKTELLEQIQPHLKIYKQAYIRYIDLKNKSVKEWDVRRKGTKLVWKRYYV